MIYVYDEHLRYSLRVPYVLLRINIKFRDPLCHCVGRSLTLEWVSSERCFVYRLVRCLAHRRIVRTVVLDVILGITVRTNY